ncbi:COG1470 family protein [[Eubacterium] cellulosolvens]
MLHSWAPPRVFLRGKKARGQCVIFLIILLISINSISSVEATVDSSIPPEGSSRTVPCCEPPRTRTSTYTAFDDVGKAHGGSLVGGLEHGDFDSDGYSELVTVGATSEGIVSLIDYNIENDSFEPTILWWDPDGALVDVAVDELDSIHPGPEVLVGGYSGRLNLLFYHNQSYTRNVTIWNSSKNESSTKHNHIYGIDIGDLDDRYTGNEIAIADAVTMNVYILTKNGSSWQEHVVPVADVPRNVKIGEFDYSHPGLELLVMCVNGSVYKVAFEAVQDTWSAVEIFKDTNTPFNAVFDDFNSTHTGNEIILTGLSWNTTIIWGSNSRWYNKTIWHAPGALEGIAYGEFDPLHEGKELCLTGYLNTAVMLYKNAIGWYNELIYSDPDPLQTELNGVLVTDFYPLNPGNELIIIGFTGKIRMLVFEPPDFKLVTSSPAKTIAVGDFTTFQIILEISSGYSSKVKLSLQGAPLLTTYNFSQSVITPSADDDLGAKSSVLTIESSEATPPGSYNLKITGTSIDDNRQRFLNLTLIIVPVNGSPDFSLEVSPTTINLNLSLEQYTAKYHLTIISLNSFVETVDLSIDESFLNDPTLRDMIDYNFTPSIISAEGTAVLTITISEDLKKTVALKLTVRAKNQALDLEHSQEVDLNIVYYEEPDETSNGDQDDRSMERWVGAGLLFTAVIILVVFMLVRIRTMSRQREAWREKQREIRASAKGRGRYKYKDRNGPKGRRKL